MKPGTMVAFILDAQVQFGILSAIIRRESTDGETRQFIVTSVNSAQLANADATITDEDDIVDMEAWNKDDRLLALAQRTPAYKWAAKTARDLDDPVAVQPEAAVAEAPKTNVPF